MLNQGYKLFLAFTDSEIPENDSRRANMLSVLLPVVKPELKSEFLSIWETWFVTEDTVEDEKFPGKLKSELLTVVAIGWYEKIVFNATIIGKCVG